MFRYVDDFFACESAECCETAMQCFATLVRCCLGDTAISERKLEAGNPLTILGVDISISEEGVRFQPSKDKVVKWTKKLKHARDTGHLGAGEAGKLAGALQWGTQYIFKRLGRAMLSPFYRRMYCRCTSLNKDLLIALDWWIDVLGTEICEIRPWEENTDAPVQLFCDARSTPPRIAAVLCRRVELLSSDCPASPLVVFFARAGRARLSIRTWHPIRGPCKPSHREATTTYALWKS